MTTGLNGNSFSRTSFSQALGAVLMIVSSVWFVIMFVTSVQALQGIYSWYPQFVAQSWFFYDELFAVFSLLGLLFGFLSGGFMLSDRNLTAALIIGILCVISGAGLSITSLIAPLAVLSKSILYYLLPSFVVPLAGMLLFSYYTREDNL
ncbi:MAG TPA: hypothetical protein VMT42_01045 [candidate division Zixibacteria bacterium]|nr:hypothetical protein [candidate division Zixibacteria bacterium]